MLPRLIELLESVPTDPEGNRNVAVIAKHLIANGVVVPVRCKDCIYREQLNDRIMCKRSAHKSDNGWFGLRATATERFCSYGEKGETDERN